MFLQRAARLRSTLLGWHICQQSNDNYDNFVRWKTYNQLYTNDDNYILEMTKGTHLVIHSGSLQSNWTPATSCRH